LFLQKEIGVIKLPTLSGTTALNQTFAHTDPPCTPTAQLTPALSSVLKFSNNEERYPRELSETKHISSYVRPFVSSYGEKVERIKS